MPFPTVGTPVTTSFTAGTSQAITLPATVDPGDILLVLVRVAVAGAIGWPDATWNELFDGSDDAEDDQMAAAWKVAVGNEDGTTITITCGNGKGAAIAWAIKGADPRVRPPELGTVTTGAGGADQSIDPTGVTPTGGAKDYLFGILSGAGGEPTGITSYPTGFTVGQATDSSGTAGLPTTNCRVAGAFRQINASSSDPGGIVYAGTTAGWTAYAIAFHPGPGVLDTVTLTDVTTVRLVYPIGGPTDTITLTATATVLLGRFEWYGAANLLDMPHLADTVTLSDDRTVLIPVVTLLEIPAADLATVTDDRTVLIPIEGVLQIPTADQVTVQDEASAVETPLNILSADTLTVTDDALLAVASLVLMVDDAVTLSDVSSVGVEQWYGQIHLLVQPQRSEVVTLTDVPTVGNDRYAEVAWIELEVPATSTEIDVPFGILNSGQIQVQLKYRGSSNKVRGIRATNVSGQTSTFIVNDNGTEHIVTIPNGTVDQEIILDEEVTLGNGVSCNLKVMKGEPQ